MPSASYEWQAALIDSVRSSRFVPFLGPDASALRLNCPDEWEKVTYRLIQIYSVLAEEGNGESTAGEIKYLETFMKAYHLDDEFKKLRKSKEKSNRENTDSEAQELLDLRFYLVKLGAILVKLFGERMVDSRACVENLVDYKVPLDNRNDDTNKTFENLKGALDAIRKYITLHQEQFPNLETEEIYNKLLSLAKHIADSLKEDLEELMPEHADKIKELEISPDDRGFLRLDELAWLEDLLWHTLRFDIRDYLNTNEMTFRLSLTTFKTLNRRELLQVVAELQQKNKPVEYMKKWIKYCEDRSDEPADLQLFIAKAMLLKYWKNRQQKESHQLDERPDDEQSEEISDDRGLHLPVIFTISFDRQLERAFDSLHVPYHLVFPIEVKRYSKQETYDLKWVYKTVIYDEDGDLIRDKDLKGCEWKDEKKDWDAPLLGPIIVKMHGSPAESLLSNKIDSDLHAEIKHLLVLSEHNYFDTSFDEKTFPTWIKNQFKSAGDWWFLGYPIDDWFMRLRISHVLNFSRESDQDLKPRVAVVHPDYDDLRTYVLHNLNIRRTPTELKSIIKTLKDMPELSGLPSEYRRGA